MVTTVTVGVAVTVGLPSSLAWKLRIPAVTAVPEGSMARLIIHLDNAGQTFASATGTVSCAAAGKDRSFPALAGATLPGQSVDITVNAPGVPEKGGIPCGPG